MKGAILLVEDHEGTAQVLQQILEEREYRTVAVADGLSAMERAAAALRPPDLVITDYHLPDLDGVALLGRLWDLPGWETVPGLILTAVGAGEVQEVARDCPKATVLQKPVDPTELLSFVQTLVGGAG
jgi:CheY-like chemotaxis protein